MILVLNALILYILHEYSKYILVSYCSNIDVIPCIAPLVLLIKKT